MIAQKFRLKRWRVQKLLKQPASNKIGAFIVKTLPNKLSYDRWSVIVSKKIEKRATERNLKRRQIYESVRIISKDLQSKVPKQHFDIAIIPYKHIAACNYQKIHQNVKDIFKFLLSIGS